MAEEHLQLQRRPKMSVLRVFLMHLLENAADGVPVAHLELGEVLILGVEPLLEVGDGLPAVLELLDLLEESFQLDAQVGFSFGQQFEQFGVVLLVLPEVADEVLVDEVEEHLVDVELEGEQEEGGEDVLALHSPHYLLHESYLIQLPLHCLRVLVQRFLLRRRLLLRSLPLQRRVLPQGQDIRPLLPVDFEYLLEEVADGRLLLLVLE
jgi:hypothetical protein